VGLSVCGIALGVSSTLAAVCLRLMGDTGMEVRWD
jgi:hypothetical protein